MTESINPLTASIDELARIAFDTYYADELATPELRAAYIADIAPDMTLADALDADIADLLHNANERDLFPFLDTLSDADFAKFQNRFDNDTTFDELIAAIARIAESL
jgi:hypothetical protein